MQHPLEPLTPREIQQTVRLLQEAGHLTSTTRVISMSLLEPPKEWVYRFSQGDPLIRRAFVVLFDNSQNACYEATLCLDTQRVITHTHIPGVQPTMSMDEQMECEQAVLQSEKFRSALRKNYGIEDPSLVMVDIWSAGNYGSEEDRTLRLARPLCFLRSDPTDNGYARPLEGIRPVVDLNEMRVLRVEEHGHWPIPPQAGNYAAERTTPHRTDIRPLEIVQPGGPSFDVDGNCVHWQNWSFVIGFNGREGLVLHQVCYNDLGTVRPILYRASLSEMVVPYGDPAPQQARKNAFDAGEYGLGYCTNSLELGCDCLGVIRYFDGHLCTSRGEAYTTKNAICMHEEDFGILWKHTDRRIPDQPEVRRSRRLVVSSIVTVENYEYGFFWYLYQDGNIQFEIKLTGILSLGALHPGERSKFGALIAPQLYAPNHQHFFNMRLDLDIDGVENCAYQLDVVADPPGPQNPYENAFAAVPQLLKTELSAGAHLNLETARSWKFVNPNRCNAVGEPVGYRFLPGDNCVPFASKNAWWRKRAGFVDYHVWVTHHHEDERHAAGNYPNQSSGGDGLPRWIQEDRSLVNQDLVLWYTFGHTHLARPEDYPVMPMAYLGFLLKPSGFFSQNPANDVPPSPKKLATLPCCNT
ncbi:MAG: primary-amine oxidase [Planctomycetota bacterium]|nr:primary-amine oxidase [Planctomycetota bacterium]MDA1178782.1 primary-amine oxidase [Planctomycetota bacterium]